MRTRVFIATRGSCSFSSFSLIFTHAKETSIAAVRSSMRHRQRVLLQVYYSDVVRLAKVGYRLPVLHQTQQTPERATQSDRKTKEQETTRPLEHTHTQTWKVQHTVAYTRISDILMCNSSYVVCPAFFTDNSYYTSTWYPIGIPNYPNFC